MMDATLNLPKWQSYSATLRLGAAVTAPEYADALVEAIAARVLAASGPISGALIREAALPVLCAVIDDCAELAAKGHARVVAVEIRKLKEK